MTSQEMEEAASLTISSALVTSVLLYLCELHCPDRSLLITQSVCVRALEHIADSGLIAPFAVDYVKNLV